MVHRKDGVKFIVLPTCEETVRREWSEHQHIMFCFFDFRLNYLDFFFTDQSFVSGMRIQSKYSDLGTLNTKITNHRLVHDLEFRKDYIFLYCCMRFLDRDML